MNEKIRWSRGKYLHHGVNSIFANIDTIMLYAISYQMDMAFQHAPIDTETQNAILTGAVLVYWLVYGFIVLARSYIVRPIMRMIRNTG